MSDQTPSSFITLHSACDYPSGGRRPVQISQLNTPQASKKFHNSIHNHCDDLCWPSSYAVL